MLEHIIFVMNILWFMAFSNGMYFIYIPSAKLKHVKIIAIIYYI
jgi:hypothetical protein